MTHEDYTALQVEVAKDLSITIKNVKLFEHRRGIGLTADVYHNGKHFANASDEGIGGCMDVRPCSYTTEDLSTFHDIESKLRAMPKQKVISDQLKCELEYDTSFETIVNALTEA